MKRPKSTSSTYILWPYFLFISGAFKTFMHHKHHKRRKYAFYDIYVNQKESQAKRERHATRGLILEDVDQAPRPARLKTGDSGRSEKHGHHIDRFNPRSPRTKTWLSWFQSTLGVNTGRIQQTNRPLIVRPQFQSTPGINTGRIKVQPSPEALPGRFNPRPALIPGESLIRCRKHRHFSPCFNPRPALIPGE